MTTTFVEYIWLGGENELRSKTRVLYKPVNSLYDIPEWDYDGSSTKQAEGKYSEIILKPCAIYRDPYRIDTAFLVLCETYLNDKPLSNNYREMAKNIFAQKLEEQPWYGLEQEYFLYDNDTNLPLGFPKNGKQGQYYCSVGIKNAFGRKIAEEHMLDCIFAGITISGINAEVAPGQWEYQIGPCTGIDAADQLWVARYILQRTTEKYGVYVCLDPKPLSGWNGSGCHTNFSTLKMREPGGLKEIYKAIDKLALVHNEHIALYGEDNEKRLTGLHETSSFTEFSWGKADRNASVRVGNKTIKDECGYFEDRRPSSNMNPYLVTSKIFQTVCL
jgi:glutamine synthetase